MINPNVIILKIDSMLHMFPINGNGEIMGSSIPFESDYEINEHQIIFSTYDTITNSSVEVVSFTLNDKIINIMKNNKLADIIKYILNDLNIIDKPRSSG